MNSDKLISAWNAFSKKTCTGLAASIALEIETQRLLSMTQWTEEHLLEAIENYRKARESLGSNFTGGDFNLPNFVKRIASGQNGYMPGYFDMDNYDSRKRIDCPEGPDTDEHTLKRLKDKGMI